MREGRGGGLSRTCLKPGFPACEKKNCRDIYFTEKEWASQISADSEELGKSLRNGHVGPACTEPFNKLLRVQQTKVRCY